MLDEVVELPAVTASQVSFTGGRSTAGTKLDMIAIDFPKIRGGVLLEHKGAERALWRSICGEMIVECLNEQCAEESAK